MGLSGSAFQYKLDDSDSYVADPGDQLLTGNDKQFWIPDATFGIYITNNTIYAGAAMSDLFGSSLKLGVDPVLDDYRTARNYNLMAGYRIAIEESGFLLEPSILVWATKYNFLTDINARLFYNDDYWFGLSYRTNNTIIVMTGIRYEMFYFGYSYDASLGTVRNYNSGSHEMMLGIRFGDNSSRRFR
jgi:type IX secretion system PorP/SprF family membrane protein